MGNNNYVSLGFQCTVPRVFEGKRVKGKTLPFDWMLSSPKFVYEMLLLLLSETDIDILVRKHFFNCKDKANLLHDINGYPVLEHYITSDNGFALLNKDYNVVFPHDSYDEVTIQKYIRRFERLKEIIISGQDTTYVFISYPSKETGNFLIDGHVVLNDIDEYLNKIYDLIKSKTSMQFKLKVFSFNNSNLSADIEYIKIEEKHYWAHTVEECVNKL
jgi:hypothetical protein